MHVPRPRADCHPVVDDVGLDLTADLGIPAFAGVSGRVGGRHDDVIVGLGAHLDPRPASTSVPAEVDQFLPAVFRTNPDGLDDPARLRWFTGVRTADQPWLRPDPAAALTMMVTYRSQVTGDVAGDLAHGVGTARRHGTGGAGRGSEPPRRGTGSRAGRF